MNTARIPDEATPSPRRSRGAWRTAWYGLSSLFGVLVFPLGYWWCRRLDDLKTNARLEQGCGFVLPGIQGKSPVEFAVARGLADGGVRMAVEVFDWTTGFWPFFLFHLRARFWQARMAERLAAKILAYQAEFPGRPVHVMGHSGGGGLALLATEVLAERNKITSLILLAPAVSHSYDVTSASARVEQGIWHFYSPSDCLFDGLGTILAGTFDGRHTVSAGARGFTNEVARLHQERFRPAMLRSWNFGGHFGCVNRVFAADWLAPLICRAGKP